MIDVTSVRNYRANNFEFPSCEDFISGYQLFWCVIIFDVKHLQAIALFIRSFIYCKNKGKTLALNFGKAFDV